jgi:predicted CopG family antitoxin
MATKTLTITEEAYKRLAMRKKENESFSDVINRLAGKGSILEFAGMFSEKEAKAIEKSIKESRRRSRKRMKRFSW